MKPTAVTTYSRRVPIGGHPGRIFLVVLGIAISVLIIFLPLASIFYNAFRDGVGVYWDYIRDPYTIHALKLTLLAALIAVPVNTVFGLCAAWAVAKFDFRGRSLLISLIELPLSVSPIVIGVAYLFVFGMQGLFGPWLMDKGIRLVFTVPAIVIVTTIVTIPFIFREILPTMQSQGTEEEQAAISLGASGLGTFFKVTLPNIKWALIYGISLCTARCLGEFGSVAIVSGAVRGETNTLTLQIELLFQDRVQTGAFAVATILTSIAILTMLVKVWAEHREGRRPKASD